MQRMIALSPTKRRAMGAAGREKMEKQFDSQLVNRAYLNALAKLGPEMSSD